MLMKSDYVIMRFEGVVEKDIVINLFFSTLMKIHNCQTKCDILLVIHAYQAVITTGDVTICSEMDMYGHKDLLCASCWCRGGKNMSSCGVWWIIAWMKMSYTSVIFCEAKIGWNCRLFNISAPNKDMPLSSDYLCHKMGWNIPSCSQVHE